jgi:hypothetical protein
MSPWQEYKKKLGNTRPWDALSPSTEKAPDSESKRRYDICLECPRLIKITKQCLECGCIMPIKTKLKEAVCPIGKW